MPCYDKVNGVLRQTAKIYDKVDGVLREVNAGYDKVNGTLRQYHNSEIDLYNKGTEVLPIAYMSGFHDYGGERGVAGAWREGDHLTLQPQGYWDGAHGMSPEMTARVDFNNMNFELRYLNILLYIVGWSGKIQMFANSAPNGTRLKELNFATRMHCEGSNTGSGTHLEIQNMYKFSGWGIPMPTDTAGGINRWFTLCADLSKTSTKNWSLSLDSGKPGWGYTYSACYQYHRIWLSNEIPSGVQFNPNYQQQVFVDGQGWVWRNESCGTNTFDNNF